MRTRHNSTLQSLPTIQINQSLKTQKYQLKSPPIIEIYDLEALEIDSQLSSLSSCSSTNELSPLNNIQKQPHHHNHSQSNSLYSSSSASCSPRSSIESSSLFHSDSSFEKPFTFQEFISSIINCNDEKWHKLIIQDLARLLEHKFRDFKKSFAASTKVSINSSVQNANNHKIVKGTNASIYLNTESDLFTYVAEKIFELASEEPNGILGAVINMRLQCESGQMYTICQSVPYDTSTIATSEITITLKEDVTGLKKFLQAIKFYSNVGRYMALHIDTKNFDTNRVRLY